ncbi:hypothetical protein LCGC14_0458340 [marine sediment metagenome]|uniref:6-pyruvoyl tetrahydrobiopterin synthase n=1 Tax=marine sediment metagenome TaxID=412755 RepID=A0A0F9SFM0_9ZZZZ
MIKIGKVFEFHAAHLLPNHEGNCKSLHGHSYKLLVEVRGDIKKEGSETGMIMDYGNLKKIVKKEVLDKYDHSNLNDYFENPTVEVMMDQMLYDLRRALPVRLTKVQLWETSTSYAEWTND